MICIRPIRADETATARRVICTVAYNIFGFDGSLEDSILHFEASGEYHDLDDLQAHYFENRGLFLAVLDDDRLIGTGAVRRLDETTCELKRMWLLDEYHGKGIGYQIFARLHEFSVQSGYQTMRLQTSHQQARALHFYRRLGFHEIPCYNAETDEISMEMKLLASG